jgi:uncharacterized protein YhdP
MAAPGQRSRACARRYPHHAGPAIAARYQRQRQGKGAWKLVRGGIGVNVPAPEPDSGMMINASLKSLNVDQWTSLGKRSIAGPQRQSQGGRVGAGRA